MNEPEVRLHDVTITGDGEVDRSAVLAAIERAVAEATLDGCGVAERRAGRRSRPRWPRAGSHEDRRRLRRVEVATTTLWRCGGRDCGAGECEHDENKLHRHASGPGPDQAPGIVHEVLRSSGSPLPTGVRATMEQQFGHDFADVRIHTDAAAGRSAAAVNALAYTVGRHVVFGTGHYDPASASGQQLLRHELSHAADAGPGAAVPEWQPARQHASGHPGAAGSPGGGDNCQTVDRERQHSRGGGPATTGSPASDSTGPRPAVAGNHGVQHPVRAQLDAGRGPAPAQCLRTASPHLPRRRWGSSRRLARIC